MLSLLLHVSYEKDDDRIDDVAGTSQVQNRRHSFS
jgi:hypothetical protein